MYTSLDRIDITTKDEDTGRTGYVQTDHRSAAEIEAEPERSVLFALTRVMAPLSMGEREGGADVSYVCMQAPPAFLAEAVAAAGGRLLVDSTPVPLAAPVRSAAEIADAAFRGLASRLLRGQALDKRALTRIEDETLQQPPNQEEDEGAYWTRAFDLAALAGELLRARVGGEWIALGERDGLFGFAFKASNATFNVFDKVQRFLEQGESQRPSQLLRMAEDLGSEQGPLMVNLKPGSFPRDRGICRELLASGPRFPLIFLGHDQPNSFGYLPAGTPDSDRSFSEALANLARLELPAEEQEIAGLKFLVVSDHYYASEKILDRAFMQSLHRRLDAELLTAAIPHKGVLVVSRDVVPPFVVGIKTMAETLHAGADGGTALSPLVFLLKDGEVVGHIDSREDEAATAKEAKRAAPQKPLARKPKQGFWPWLRGH